MSYVSFPEDVLESSSESFNFFNSAMVLVSGDV